MKRPLGGLVPRTVLKLRLSGWLSQVFTTVERELRGDSSMLESFQCILETCTHTTLTWPEPLFHPVPSPHHIPQDPVRTVGCRLWEVGENLSNVSCFNYSRTLLHLQIIYSFYHKWHPFATTHFRPAVLPCVSPFYSGPIPSLRIEEGLSVQVWALVTNWEELREVQTVHRLPALALCVP